MKSRNYNLDVLRIMAVLDVVLVHTAVRTMSYDPSITSLKWWVANLANSFGRWPSLIFLMVSGALLFPKATVQPVKVFYQKRAERLLIPLLFWTVFYFAWRAFFRHEDLTLTAIAKSLILGTPNGHMWYLYMIAGMYLVMPFLAKIVREMTDKDLVIFILVLFLAGSVYEFSNGVFENRIVFLARWIPYVGHVLCGYYIYTKSIFLKVGDKHILLTILFFSCSLLVALFTGLLYPVIAERSWQIVSFRMNPIIITQSVLLFLIILGKQVEYSERTKKLIVKISSLTFGVYLVHIVFLDLLAMVGISGTSFHPLLSIPVTVILTFALSLAFSYIISKIPLLKKVI